MNDDCIARNTKSNFVYSMCSLDVNNYCTTLFVISILFVSSILSNWPWRDFPDLVGIIKTLSAVLLGLVRGIIGSIL